MHRASPLLLLSLLCLSGCESPGGNSLAAFGPNTVPPPVREPGRDPYYTASSAAPEASSSPKEAAVASRGDAPQPGQESETAIPATSPSIVSVAPTPVGSSNSTREPPIRIVEREGGVPMSTRQPAETSRLPATSVPATSSPAAPSPLHRTSTVPQLQPIPSSAFGKKSSSNQIVPASYEEGVADQDGAWRRR